MQTMGPRFPIRRLISAVVIVVLVASLFFLFARDDGYLLTEVGRAEISVDEKTTISVRARNISEKDLENVEIQLATKSPYVLIYYPERPFIRVGDENQLIIPIGHFRSGEETRKYIVDVSGSLPPGTLSMEVEVSVRLLVGEERVEELVYTLKIRSGG